MANVIVEMFPAREGDCLLVTCTDGNETQRVLFDGGRAGTYAALKPTLEALPADQRTLDLLVVTHVDRDHIEGVLKLFDDPERPVRFDDIWFNGFHHLKDEEAFGAKQGEQLTTHLMADDVPWNGAFAGAAVRVEDAPVKKTIGDLSLTILSPDAAKLLELHPTWVAECEKAGLIPQVPPADNEMKEGEESFGPPDVEALAATPFEDDDTVANGSSIAVLLEYGGYRALMAGDAHVDRLVASLKSLGATKDAPLELDLFKIAHHGSSHNVSQELLELVRCPRYLISTSGAYFKHPRADAIARIVKYGGDDKQLEFNYATKQTQKWQIPALQKTYGYRTRFGDDGYLRVELGA